MRSEYAIPPDPADLSESEPLPVNGPKGVTGSPGDSLPLNKRERFLVLSASVVFGGPLSVSNHSRSARINHPFV